MPLFCLKITPVMFFSKHVKKNYFNVVIELLPNPGLVYSPVCETGPMCFVLMATPIINW